MHEKLISVTRVADIIGIKPNSVYGLIATGSLIATDVSVSGKPRWKFRTEDVENFLRARSTEKRRQRVEAYQKRAKRAITKPIY